MCPEEKTFSRTRYPASLNTIVIGKKWYRQ
ncbi:hypothetical protein NXF25_019068 [Crotalus adamanteus]|uniref:Uncharacterized protein n=1 Tax=Crotalus adamanteus TaxID=8729 RepID=A0AAW1B1C3_CROAD